MLQKKKKTLRPEIRELCHVVPVAKTSIILQEDSLSVHGEGSQCLRPETLRTASGTGPTYTHLQTLGFWVFWFHAGYVTGGLGLLNLFP